MASTSSRANSIREPFSTAFHSRLAIITSKTMSLTCDASCDQLDNRDQRTLGDTIANSCEAA